MADTNVREHLESLVAQCPLPLVISPADAARLPIHVTKWGDVGPRVLLIHGGVQGGVGGGPSTYLKQENLARQGWQVEVADRPGFGGSPTRGVDDMEADADWIAEMLGGGAHLVGHSWGGAEVILAASRRPDAVRSLILIEPALTAIADLDPTLRADPAISAGADARLAILMRCQTPAEYGRAFVGLLGSATDDAGPNEFAASLDLDQDLAIRVGCALLQGRVASPPALRDAINIISSVRIPVLSVSGGWNAGFDAAGAAIARLTGGRHVIIRAPSHFVQMANAEVFNREVDAFMRAADAGHRIPILNAP